MKCVLPIKITKLIPIMPIIIKLIFDSLTSSSSSCMRSIEAGLQSRNVLDAVKWRRILPAVLDGDKDGVIGTHLVHDALALGRCQLSKSMAGIATGRVAGGVAVGY